MLAMLFIPTVPIALTSLCASTHYEALQLCNAVLPRMRLRNSQAKVLIAVGAALVSHVLQIGLFAAAFYFLQDVAHLGSLGGNFKEVASSFLYFATETYTSLGFGDVFQPASSLAIRKGVTAQ